MNIQTWPLNGQKSSVPALAKRQKAFRLTVLGWVLLTALLCLWSANVLATKKTATAHPAPPEPKAEAAEVVPAAKVVIFNREIATLRASNFGELPEMRARFAKARIKELLDNPGQHAVEIKPIPQGLAIQIDGRLAFIIMPGDVDPETGESTEAAAQNAVKKLEIAIDETEESRNISRILQSVGLAALGTILFYFVLWGAHRSRRFLQNRLTVATQRLSERAKISGVPLFRMDRVLTLVQGAVSLLFWGFSLVLTYIWVGYTLSRFPHTRQWGEILNTFILDVVFNIISAILGALPDLFIALLIFLLARLVVRLLHSFFDMVQNQQVQLSWLDAELATPTRRIANIIIWLFALAMAYPYLPGAHTEALKGVTLLVGLMVSLGASGLVGQAVSGLILTYTRVFRHGEYVRVADNEGTVMETGMFATRIRTGMGEELMVPNSLILSNITRNYSRAVQGSGFIVSTTVTIGYDTPWRQVHAMLLEAAKRTYGVLQEPAPRVYQIALSDFYPEYRLVCQAVPLDPRSRAEVMTTLHANIQDVFNEYGVQIMSPHYFSDPAAAKVVPVKNWHLAPAEGDTPIVQEEAGSQGRKLR